MKKKKKKKGKAVEAKNEPKIDVGSDMSGKIVGSGIRKAEKAIKDKNIKKNQIES